MKKKMLAAFLSLTLAITAVPTAVFAEPDAEEAFSAVSSFSEAEEETVSEIEDETISEVEEEELSEETQISDSETEDEEDSQDSGKKEKKDKKSKKKDLVLPAPGTVTGFEIMSPEDSLVTLNQRCSLEELYDQMPETFLVYLDNSAEAVEIPVTWVSEVDFETTEESYYIFWADWDREMFPLAAGYGYEDYMPFVEVVLERPMMMSLYSEGIDNILARARQQVDIRWTPLKKLNGFYSNSDPLTVYSAGMTYNGIPYGQQVSSGKWCPNSVSFDTFLEAVKNPSSPLYLSRGSYGDMNSTYYANDCSSFASYCYGLPRMTTWSFGYSSQFTRVAGNSIYNAEVGDCFNMSGAHIELITGMNYDGAGKLVSVEVSEQTPPKARTVIYTPAQAQRLINKGYTLLRFIGRDSVAEPEYYNGYESDLAAPVKVDYGTEADSELTITDRNGDGSIYDLRITGLQMYSKTDYQAAIWSRENGQDDLKWFKLTRQSDASYTSTVKISDFRHKGEFFLHLYKMDGAENICLKKTSFFSEPDVDPAETADVTAESVSLENVNNDAGTCRILISGVRCADGVSKIQVPTWSNQNGQDDIIWYNAKQLNDTTWYVDFSIANHKNAYDTYQIHVYGTNKRGKRVFCGRTTAVFTEPEPEEIPEVTPEASAEVKDMDITITAKNLFLQGGIKSILIPTWSAEGAQDDIRWEKASYDPVTGTAVATINAGNYKHYGLFYSHVYATDRDGKMVFMTNTTFKVEEPEYTENEITSSYDPATGDFKVSIGHPRCADGSISSIIIPIWSAAKQADIIWYNAVKKSGDTWTVSGNIKNHAGIGSYNCHVYARVNGKMVYIGQTVFTAAITTASVEVGETMDGNTYPITVKGLSTPLALNPVYAAVWSEKNGQDDLVWYTLKTGSGTAVKAGQTVDLKGAIDLRRHKTAGSYLIHIYGVTTSGKYQLIHKMTADIDSRANADFRITDPVPGDGQAELTISISGSDWDFSQVTVPVWSSSDQSDIYWYPATKAADGTWRVTLDKKNHKNHTGTYHIHTYCIFNNGIMGFVGKTTTVLD